MKRCVLILFLVLAVPLYATELELRSDDIVLQVVERDLDRNGLEDRATLLKRGAWHLLVVEPAGEERVILRIHPQNFDHPELVYNEDARYVMLGERGKGRKAWLLRNVREGVWGLAADSHSGIDAYLKQRSGR